MSAFVVSREHIVRLVNVQLHKQARGYPHVPDIDELGRMLWTENLKSVQSRYPNDTNGNRPGPVGFMDEHADEFIFNYMSDSKPVNPVECLKLVNCYEYQSCEHPGWEESEAYRWCQDAKSYLVSILPGYDDALWTV